MKNKKILQIISLIICLSVAPSMSVFAEEEPKMEKHSYSDTDQIPYVDDIDEYLAQLNAGLITPSKNAVITTYESTITPFDLSEPSKSCSNIFGHKWGDWSNWREYDKIHYPTLGRCLSKIERWHCCERTHCGATQTETDSAWVTCTH